MTWCAEDFEWFFQLLTTPDGHPTRLEGYIRLIIRMVFATGRVELLVLLPKGNGKTMLFAALAVFHLLTTPNANCYIGAADKIQADEMYRFASHFVDSEPELGERLLVRRSTREIRSRRDQGFIKVLASDDSKLGGKKQGFNPTLALIDELHAHDNANLYRDLRSGLFKRGGLLVTITTAGWDEESILGVLRQNFLDLEEQGGTIQRNLTVHTATGAVRVSPKNGRLTIAATRSGRTAMLEWACRPTDDLSDMRVVKLASPASFVTVASLEDAAEAPGMTAADFARWRANVWAQAPDAVIAEDAWDALHEPGASIPAGAPVWVMVDYARKSDSTAVVELYTRPDGKVIPRAHVWALEVKQAGRAQPPHHTLIRGDRTIRQSLVREHIRNIRDVHGQEVLGVIYDPHLFDPEELADEGFTMIEFPQKPERTVPASKRLLEAISDGMIAHDGDPVLRSHVVSAGQRVVGEGWRFSKAASKKRIDACICLMMGVGKALERPASFGMEWR